jgi:hypothetical protein
MRFCIGGPPDSLPINENNVIRLSFSTRIDLIGSESREFDAQVDEIHTIHK